MRYPTTSFAQRRCGAATTAQCVHPSAQGWRRVAAVAAVAWALASPAACSDGDDGGVCLPPAFALQAEPDDLAAHCALRVAAECQRAFDDCPDLGVYGVEYPNAAACEAEAPADLCASTWWSTSYLADDVASACLAAIPEVACDELAQEGGPKACWGVELPVPPDPAKCDVITEGVHHGTLDTKVSLAWGTFAAVRCLCLEKGDHVSLTIAHGDLDSPAIHVFTPDGEALPGRAFDERRTVIAAVTGSYLVVVAEQHAALEGQPFELTIDIAKTVP